MKRCYGYIRVSTVKQSEGASLAAQQDAILAFASRNFIEITKWFEETETAAKGGRPTFNQMLRELHNRKADGVIFHKIDRSSRNFGDWDRIGKLAEAGIDIHFATESLDFRSRGGRLSADIQAVFAADYIRNLREEIIKGINGRLKAGLYPFRAPIGYLDNGKGKVKTFDPRRAPLVKMAFELYGSRRYSYRTLLAELQKQGLTNRYGRRLSMCGLETLLGNPFYTGVIHIKRTGMTYHGVHERLISPGLFARVQAIRAGKSGPMVTRHDHTYRGLFRCGYCNGPMVPELQKGHVYYRCKTRECPTKTVREEALETAIKDCLAQMQLTEADAAAFLTRIDTWVTAATSSEQEKAWLFRKAALEERIDRLTDALVDRLIDRDAFSDRRKRLALEEEALEVERLEMGNRIEKAAQMRSLAELAKSLCLSHKLADTAEKRRLVEMTTSNRRVIGKDVYLEPSNWLAEVENT